MALSLQKFCMVVISVLVVFFPSPHFSLPHRLLSNKCPSHESEALLRFKEGLNDSDGFLSSWVNGTDCCTMWDGISCSNDANHVVSVSVISLQDVQGVIGESLCQIRFLKSLTINKVTGTTTVPPCLGNLPYIDSLNLSFNSLSGKIPSFVCLLTSLTHLDLSFNKFNGSIPFCLENLSSLTWLSLSNNQLSGSIPASLANISSLKWLELDHNLLSGSIPASLGSLSLLWDLSLGNNQLSGNIPDSLGNLSLLSGLSLLNNQLTGTIPPSFAQLSSLNRFYGSGNHFNETISSSSFPASLEYLYLSLNHQQVISETFFQNLTNLKFLYLSDCVLNISKTWIPSFQLTEISLESCKINREIPVWICTQFSVATLELVNNSLVGKIPSWLWETSSQLQHLNLSGNHLEGSLFSNASMLMQLERLDVSRNALSGHIPSIWSPKIQHLLLNDNLFNGSIPPSLGKLSLLEQLNLANNFLTGVIPPSLSECSFLQILNLANNNLEGSLPHEFSRLSKLYSLIVHSNNLRGSLPPSIANCSELQVLDVGNNSFGGEIPTFVGNLPKLRVLVMKDNNFTGSIPSKIGHLLNLQILLLSSNHISGSIPHTITSLQAMAIESQDGFILSTSQLSYALLYQDGLDMTLKGTNQHYPYILSTFTSIDLSNNELEGEVSSNFGNLKGLRLLNLSFNNLNGSIPNSFGEMSQLESLDLSRNNFSGQIPAELESLSYLASLNLSNNNLSGSIPQGQHMTDTFGESSYSGNANLWGCPLPKNCSWPQFATSPPFPINKEKKSNEYPWFQMAVGLSFGAAFGGIMALILIRISWRMKYFNKVDTILKFLFPWMKNLTL
ncbi:receptor like protein 27 [Cryptomeria japonica]|uniref:receptor like protein 27 n=1 Tax=Cryptomeria japonica TaxID=3369 RepID=UPI0027DA61D8|nr:receptor like protein 27 [Cryptomeria japonica]